MASNFVYEIPSSLKQLMRMVVRMFYTIEDVLIIDTLVSNGCMKEEDIAELLRFEKKQLRARILVLRNDKLVKIRFKVETGAENKSQKVNYYYLNYTSFVNVVKYKLEFMRKHMESEERNMSGLTTLRCTVCSKAYTDLEADLLFDRVSESFRCTFCLGPVEEDENAELRTDTHLMLARFNEQLEPLYDLLRQFEGTVLATELLEPEPVSIDEIRGMQQEPCSSKNMQGWTQRNRGGGMSMGNMNLGITIAMEETTEVVETKEQPIWLTDSTVIPSVMEPMAEQTQTFIQATTSTIVSENSNEINVTESIMAVLMQHEQPSTSHHAMMESFGYTDQTMIAESVAMSETVSIPMAMQEPVPEPLFEPASTPLPDPFPELAAYFQNDNDESIDVPMVLVANHLIPVDQVTDELIALMNEQEKDAYIKAFQHHFSFVFD